jgi:CDP-diacylglycerol--glycerol-3-phosphate 3-phosphatidyltransferase
LKKSYQLSEANNQINKTARILPKRLMFHTSNSLNKLVPLFIKLNISANALTLAALFVGMGAGLSIALGYPLLAGILIIVCGILDILDGKVAAQTHKKSLFGAIFDSTLDRYSEFFIYLGLAFHFRHHWALWITFLTILGSTMVSYTRARSEGLGIECWVGMMQRAERMVLLTLASIVGSIFKVFDPAAIAVLITIAIVSNAVAIQRTLNVRKVEKKRKAKE